ncbi:MAG: ABC transporter substrate-binding protein [Aquificota bacterium]|nr:ABC transporter substrate-binding protein [Aquificota bacterium]
MVRLLIALMVLAGLSLAEEVLRLGAAVSFTGKYAKEGELLRRGYELWKEKVNSMGGIKVGNKRYRVEIVYYDDQSDPKTTAKLVEKLIVEDGIKFILGPYGSAQVLPLRV